MAQFERYNFKTIIAGSYYNGTNFTMYSDAARTQPIDISGALITMTMRRNFDLPVVFTFSNDGDGDGQIVITDGSLGKFSIIGTNMDIPAGRYVYTISILTYTDENKKYITGEWVIEPTT
jgi:hypothetical protein